MAEERYGVFRFNLHPIGKYVCVVCQRVYPRSFECCPGLVDIAFDAYAHPSDDWGPKTAQRISAFLHSHPYVVKNTAQLRLLQSRFREIGAEIGEQVRQCIENLGLSDIIREIADELGSAG
ncbi:MAG TPA: hypothetical protein VFI31_16545 [Pirellulales bacterium]|nr:hypothetical protein [Pirellulales bacterium]